MKNWGCPPQVLHHTRFRVTGVCIFRPLLDFVEKKVLITGYVEKSRINQIKQLLRVFCFDCLLLDNRMVLAEVFDTTFFDTDTILIPCRYGYSIPIRYWYFSVIKFRYWYWYWYFSAIKVRYRYWYWYFHQMDWYPIWYQFLLEIAIFLPKNQWNQSF